MLMSNADVGNQARGGEGECIYIYGALRLCSFWMMRVISLRAIIMEVLHKTVTSRIPKHCESWDGKQAPAETNSVAIPSE